MKLWLGACVALLVCVASPSSQSHFVSMARADPGDACTASSDCDEGERCKRSSDGGDGVCVARKPPGTPGHDGQPPPDQRQTQLYCYDVYGNRRCMMPPNFGGPGLPCTCPGIPGVGTQNY